MRTTLQTIFARHFAEYAQTRPLHPREWRAGSAITDCFTAALGGHVLTCPAGHGSHTQYHACRHRSCPRCAERPRHLWVEAELQRLLPCAHFHAVFTLPHVFLPLWRCNRARLNALLFDCARQSLLQLCADERHLGATPGLLMALHTWGRDLALHPHVHCLVSAGGVDPEGRWRDSRPDYLVPVKALCALFRGKMLHALRLAIRRRHVDLPAGLDAAHWHAVISAQYRKHWNVELAERYGHGRGVALYLARYVKGGPLPADRPLHLGQHDVRFPYTDHRDGKSKVARFATHTFIDRVLSHAPPRAQHMVRHCGLYATAARAQHQRCMQHLAPSTPPILPPAAACHQRSLPQRACPTCQAPMERTLSLLPTHRFSEISRARVNPSATAAGSTTRSSEQTTAATDLPLRRRTLRRRSTLN